MKAIVIEDSRLARDGLVRMLGSFPEIQIVAACENASAARQAIAQCQPEVLFLDIHMPGEDGFELLASLARLPKIVFTTAYSEYAIRSFDFDTVDYLVKPISTERLAQAVTKLLSQESIDKQVADKERPSLDMKSKIFIKDGERCHLVSLESIDYIESCKNYVQVFFGGQRAYVKKSMNNVEERLPSNYFFRANRQYIINLQAIQKIEESMQLGFLVTLNGGKVIEISRRNALSLKEILSL